MTIATAKEIKPLFLEVQSAVVAFFQTLKSSPGALGISPSKIEMGICCCLLNPQTNSYQAEVC
jgi:hypothetical protein